MTSATLKKPARKPASSSAAAQASISSAAALKATGKPWPAWFSLLDKAGAKTMTHKEIVAWLAERQQVGPWWRQMIAVHYEQSRSLRKKHQKPDGFQISRSITLAVPLSALARAWTDARQRSQWLEDPGFTVRTAIKDRSMRITWVDGRTSLLVSFTRKAAARSHVVVEHARLSSAAAAERMKAYWSRQLAALKGHLEA